MYQVASISIQLHNWTDAHLCNGPAVGLLYETYILVRSAHQWEGETTENKRLTVPRQIPMKNNLSNQEHFLPSNHPRDRCSYVEIPLHYK